MSINALITGKLQGQPEQRTSKAGKTFVSAKLRVSNGEDSLFAKVVAFSAEPCRILLALGAGEAIAISGTAKVSAWIDGTGNPKPNLDVVADVVLTSYALQKRRAAVASEHGQQRQPAQRQRRLEAEDDFGEAGNDDWLEGPRHG